MYNITKEIYSCIKYQTFYSSTIEFDHIHAHGNSILAWLARRFGPGMQICSCSLTLKTTISKEMNNEIDLKFAYRD